MRDGAAATRFFRRLIENNGGEPRKIVTDRLRSHGVAHRELIPEAIHDTSRYANKRAERSNEATRFGSGGCAVRRPGSSSHFGRHSDFWVHMLRLAICSTLEGTWSELSIIGAFGQVRSMSGAGRLLET